MKIINIGVLAHVDAGKTTLTESLLYNSGAITELGSVDKGTTRTDNTLLERQRGITIQTGITSFQWENTKVNIIDTPGHMDFLAEVYRSLSVLDGAILLISAKDGVQAQTRILFHALRKMGIPTIFFINKIDQNGIDLSTVYQDIKEKLSAEIVIKQKVELYPNMCVTNFTESEQWDTVIEGNDDLLEKYMSGKSLEALELEQEESIRFQNCSLFPLYHGSAKSNIGIDNLIEVITNKFYSSTHRGPSELCGNVFKIEYTKKFSKNDIYFKQFLIKKIIKTNEKIFYLTEKEAKKILIFPHGENFDIFLKKFCSKRLIIKYKKSEEEYYELILNIISSILKNKNTYVLKVSEDFYKIFNSEKNDFKFYQLNIFLGFSNIITRKLFNLIKNIYNELSIEMSIFVPELNLF